MDVSISDIKKSIIRAAKHSFLDGKENDDLVKEIAIETRLDKHFQILEPNNY